MDDIPAESVVGRAGAGDGVRAKDGEGELVERCTGAGFAAGGVAEEMGEGIGLRKGTVFAAVRIGFRGVSEIVVAGASGSESFLDIAFGSPDRGCGS